MSAIQEAVNDSGLMDHVDEIQDSIRNADDCETAKDVRANLREARRVAFLLVKDIDDILGAHIHD